MRSPRVGAQRRANGENEARAIFLLACATGNVGLPGGGTGGREAAAGLSIVQPFNYGLQNPSNKIISVFSWLDAIDHGPKMDTFNAGVGEKPAPGPLQQQVECLVTALAAMQRLQDQEKTA